MSFYFTIEREGKWEVLFSHVNGEDLIKRCNTEKQAEDIIKILEED